MTTYADVAAIARERYLIRLMAAARGNARPPQFAAIFRPLGGVLLLHLFRRPARDLAHSDAIAIDAARAMLSAWIAASSADPTPVPPSCERGALEETARLVLLEEFERHWATAVAG